MLHAVRCDWITFKTVNFQPGFNVVLAERTQESTRKDSRNGSGKTTLIEIIHFCLGAKAQRKKGLLHEQLKGWTFSIEIDLRGRRFIISRNTSKAKYVVIDGDWSDWITKPQVDKKTHEPRMSISEWNRVLGWLMFDLPVELTEEKYTPTFRSLLSYFIRRGRDAFSEPFTHHPKQFEWQKQIDNTFLLGLGWEYAQKWQVLKEQAESLRQLKQAATSGLIPDLSESIGELETNKVRLEEQVAREEEQLRNFKVHEQYQSIEVEVSTLSTQIQQLLNDNVSDRRMLEFYERSLREEQPVRQDLVVKMYEEARIILPRIVVKHLDDVQAFHQKITADRRSFLKSETDRLKNTISNRDEQTRSVIDQRASLMSILQTHGALEAYNKLQQRHMQSVTQLEEIKNRIKNLKKFEQGKIALRIEQERLQLDARSDNEERSSIRERAISLFNANSEAIHEAPGKLIINVENTGFKFQVEIERAPSQGIGQMNIFCYDLMLAQLWSTKQSNPGLLIHDSTIFDGVDERQIALALRLAARKAEEFNFQYICCLNSDSVPWDEFDAEFNLESYKRIELTDAHEDGGLLGIRF